MASVTETGGAAPRRSPQRPPQPSPQTQADWREFYPPPAPTPYPQTYGPYVGTVNPQVQTTESLHAVPGREESELQMLYRVFGITPDMFTPNPPPQQPIPPSNYTPPAGNAPLMSVSPQTQAALAQLGVVAPVAPPAAPLPPSELQQQNMLAQAQQQWEASHTQKNRAIGSSPATWRAAAEYNAEAEQRQQQQKAAPRQEHQEAMFDTSPGVATTVGPMSWAAYQALTPDQRRAVDFNTMLVQAVRRDRTLRESYSPNENQMSLYRESLHNMFGNDERVKSQMYAPETMSLLKQIGFKDPSADLSDFTSLQAAITEEELGLMDPATLKATPGQPPSGAGTLRAQGGLGPYGAQLAMKRGLATATGDAEQQMLDKGVQMLATWGPTAAAVRSAAPGGTQAMGGAGIEVADLGTGWQPPKFDQQTGQAMDLNTAFIDLFDKLATPANSKNVGSMLEQAKLHFEPNQYKAFLQYANTRSANAAQFGTSLGASGGVFQSPEQFRKLLGFKEVSESGV